MLAFRKPHRPEADQGDSFIAHPSIQANAPQPQETREGDQSWQHPGSVGASSCMALLGKKSSTRKNNEVEAKLLLCETSFSTRLSQMIQI